MADLFDGSPNLANRACPFGLTSLQAEADLTFQTRRAKPDKVKALSEINRLTLDRLRLIIRRDTLKPQSDKALELTGQIRFLTHELLKFEGKV